MKKILNVGLLALTLFFSTVAQANLEHLPIQDGGRVKPYDTYAREVLALLTGRETYKAQAKGQVKGKTLKATDVVFSWLLIPDEWEKSEFILIRHSGLREALKLETERLYYSPTEIMMNERLGLLMQDLKNRQDAKEKLDPFFQAVQTLENQLSTFHAIRMGMGMRLVPAGEDQSKPWLSVGELTGDYQEKFNNIRNAFVEFAAAEAKGDRSLSGAAEGKLSLTVQEFTDSVEKTYGDYGHDRKIQIEVFYNTWHPFRWAWAFYFCALILFSFAYFGGKARWLKAGWSLTALGMCAHAIGFSTRVYLLGRAPVTNMFETVSWVAFAVLIMAAIFYRLNRAKIVPLAATMVSTFSLILCDVSSTVLDDTLSPLEPVLRDNFWLLTHVVIIVTSYAAFFLAFFIGDILLYYYLKDEKKYADEIAQGALSIYRCIQVGVVLLAAGVILGGIWADYSWGRFWGWDPKETWAFIALLGYLVILHGRLIGWLRNFGLAAAAVLSFSLVIMAWYGVNFVLGAGLHTYGFGAGGVEYVSAFVCAHILYVVYVATLRHSRLKK